MCWPYFRPCAPLYLASTCRTYRCRKQCLQVDRPLAQRSSYVQSHGLTRQHTTSLISTQCENSGSKTTKSLMSTLQTAITDSFIQAFQKHHVIWFENWYTRPSAANIQRNTIISLYPFASIKCNNGENWGPTASNKQFPDRFSKKLPHGPSNNL